MYNTKFVQKLAFAYRNCPLSLETTKHFQAYINSLLWSGVENFPKCAVYDIFTMLHCPSLLNSIANDAKFLPFAFSGLTVLVGRQEEHPACKNWVMRCWCGYLSGVRCRLFAYGPADATATPKPPSSLALYKFSLALSFWYRLTQSFAVCFYPVVNGAVFVQKTSTLTVRG